jgi:hypothetical protein
MIRTFLFQAVILSTSKIVQWLENHTLPCFYKKYLGVECPGCGMQRSIIALLKGDILESLRIYPALGSTIILFTLLIIHLVFKLKNGGKILIWTFLINTIIVICAYIVKIL